MPKITGWSSFHPLTTERRFGIPCRDLEVQDLCLGPDHPEADYTMNLFTCLRRYLSLFFLAKVKYYAENKFGLSSWSIAHVII